MKNFVRVLGLMCLMSGLAHADSFSVKVDDVSATTNSATIGTVAGKINTIIVDVTGTTTQTLTIVSGRTGETIYTETLTADAVRRPRVPTHTTAGAAVGVATNDMVMFYLSNDTLTFTLSETAPTVDTTTTITVITE